MKQGFTLSELMVVVLIIGILSSVALPQYNKSVEKARAAEAVMAAKTLVDAAAIYATTYRVCPGGVGSLDVKMDTNGKHYTYSLVQDGEKNCGAQVTPNKGESFAAQRILVKNPNTNSLKLPLGTVYWTCKSGDCSKFFSYINVKKASNGEYYQ